MAGIDEQTWNKKVLSISFKHLGTEYNLEYNLTTHGKKIGWADKVKDLMTT